MRRDAKELDKRNEVEMAGWEMETAWRRLHWQEVARERLGKG